MGTIEFNAFIYPGNHWDNFDDIEVHGIKDVEEMSDKDGKWYAAEQCNDDEAEYWSVYVHKTGAGVICVADFLNRHAAESFAKIIKQIRESVQRK